MNVHVYPVNDLVDHDTETDDCVCGPHIQPVEAEDGAMNWVITHHSHSTAGNSTND